MSALFPAIKGMMHGGDYNPEQWLDRPDILEQDILLMKKAGINCVTLGVFAWSVYEPNEGEYHFEWLEEIVDRLYENGIYVIMATPSGARPIWLDERYPDAMRVDSYGHRYHHGVRHNHCMSSLNYRNKVGQIDTELAKRFADHPAVLLWHISNEFGGECYCDACKKRFQDYLADKFDHDIEKLNKAWWSIFWSHSYQRFEQIEPPYSNGEFSVMGLNLEWKRFTTWNMTDFMRFEIDTIRKIKPEIRVTTNYMKLFDGLDYNEMSKYLDVISWDSYPAFHNDEMSLAETFADNGFNHALFRSMKPDRPFMLMESAPGLVNWHPVNKYKRPGIHKLACMQAVAMGSDTVQYFQIRKGRGSFEQYHGAVIDHVGTGDTRVFREVEEVGELLGSLSEIAGTIPRHEVALIFDWDNRWAINDVKALSQESKNYEKTCIDLWSELTRLGVEPDIISQDADWSSYKVIVAPMMYLLHDGTGDKVKQFVEDGGQILATYFTGYVDKNQLCYLGGFPGDGLKDVFGIISEEIDSLYPEDENHVRVLQDENLKMRVKDYAELIHLDTVTAESLAFFEEDYLWAFSAVTKNAYGKGNAYYVACRTAAKELDWLFEDMLKCAGIAVKKLPENVEYHVRYSGDCKYEFYLNLSNDWVELPDAQGLELISGETVESDSHYSIEPKSAAVFKTECNYSEPL